MKKLLKTALKTILLGSTVIGISLFVNSEIKREKRERLGVSYNSQYRKEPSELEKSIQREKHKIDSTYRSRLDSLENMYFIEKNKIQKEYYKEIFENDLRISSKILNN